MHSAAHLEAEDAEQPLQEVNPLNPQLDARSMR